ncbi:MAG: NAD-dependent epimerase/dehydratase family protein [Bdellovibrionota bacterium]
MKILVTGATGLLGSHVLEQGLKRGHQVVGVVRNIPARSFLGKHPELAEKNVQTIVCDLSTDSLPDAAFKGVDAIIHCAALASADPAFKDAMNEINFESPKRLHEQARANGIRKWVQISTTAVMTPAKSESDSTLITEADFGSLRGTAYAQSKYAFDKFLETSELGILSIHPGYMLGRWDSKPSSGAILFALRMGRFKYYLDGQKNLVAAEDVARGIFQALEAGKIGRFILGGTNAKISSFLEKACEELGVPFTLNEMSLEELNQSISPDASFIREFCLSGGASSEKAKVSFAYVPTTTVSQMIKDSVDYFTENRMLKRAGSNV